MFGPGLGRVGDMRTLALPRDLLQVVGPASQQGRWTGILGGWRSQTLEVGVGGTTGVESQNPENLYVKALQ